MTKQLEKNSKFAKLDTNGDGIVSDKEFEMKEKLILLENRDKKEDQPSSSAITISWAGGDVAVSATEEEEEVVVRH